MKNFKVGDKVIITDSGESYTTYSDMFEKMGFSDTKRNGGWENGEEGIVFAVEQHPTYANIILALRHLDGRECLIGEKGVRLIDGSSISIHDQILLSLNLKKGDRVKITHVVPDYHLGWANSWIAFMTAYVGKTYTVENTLTNDGVQFEGVRYWFPAQCIEIVERASQKVVISLNDDYDATIYNNGGFLQVGCQHISYEKVKEVYEAMEKLKTKKK